MLEMTKFFRCVGCGQVLTGVEFEECEDGLRCLKCISGNVKETTVPDPGYPWKPIEKPIITNPED
jgi:recombinational DNA repair protein (RecF pathway)